MREINSSNQEGSARHATATQPATDLICLTTQMNSKRGALRTGTIIFAAIGTFLAAALVVGTMGLVFYYVQYVRPNDTQAEQTVIPTMTSPENEGEDKNFSVTDAATLPDQDGKVALSTIEIADKVGPATVSIVADVSYTSVYGTTETGQASGSGFIISSNGYIVTNNHVISGADSVQVLVPGEDEPVDAVIIGTDFTTDIAVLKIDRTDTPYVILGDSDELQVGELAVAIGNPFGELAGSVTAGVISALQRDLTIENMTYKLIQTDASINSGNSGGPLVNSYGEVIGVTNAKMSNGEGIGFAIPINDVKTVIEDLINSGYVTGRPVLGVGVMTVDEVSAEQYGWPLGVYVREVNEDGPADLAGIQIGDIITKVDGTSISSSEELVQIKNESAIGDSLLITIYRSGETLEYTVILQEEKPA